MEEITDHFDQYELLCEYHRPAELFCCSPRCRKPALVCRIDQCPCIQNSHPTCKLMSKYYLLDSFKNKRRDLNEKEKDMLEKCRRVIDQMIDELLRKRNQLKEFEEYYGFYDEEVQLIKKLDQNNVLGITGQVI